MKKKTKSLLIKVVLLLIFAAGIFFGGKSILYWMVENRVVKDIVEEEEKRLVKEEDITYLDPEIKRDNFYTVGWLIVDGTKINYPVVRYIDNDYYLNHDFKNQDNSAGWIFMDYQNKLDDDNLVIYGHHRQDGSMFGSIDNLFSKKDDENIEISLITTDEIITYKVFSVYKTTKDDDYITRNFDNFNKKVKELQEKSEVEFNQDVSKTSQIITLSTCHDNNVDRIVVHGYKN
ncbi:MAG: class B sortase [Bacilli bacterium]|nr:class B sortase [Bacilli bacterium]